MAKRKRAGSRRQRQDPQRTRTLVILGVVVLAALAGALILGRPTSGAASVDSERIALDPGLGPENAPVVITEFGDLGCTSCRAWHNLGIREQIIATYGNQVRFVFKDFPVITAQSPRAAEAAQCALDQGFFWEYHDTVYENFQGLGDADLYAYAAQIGLDAGAFGECLDSNLHRATVRADWQEAENLGLRGTPSFLINGQLLVGTPYFDTFAAQIDPILAS